MSNSKRKIAGALMLGATLTGTIGSSVTSAGLLDCFKGKDYRTNKNIEKQTNGYNAAISVAKKIYKLDKDKIKNKDNKDQIENDDKNEEKKSEDKKSKSENKSVLEILEDLFFEKVENANKNKNENSAYTEYLKDKVKYFWEDAANTNKSNVIENVLKNIKECCAIRRSESNNNNNNNDTKEDVYVLDNDATAVEKFFKSYSLNNEPNKDIEIDGSNKLVVIVKSGKEIVDSRIKELYGNNGCVKIENLEYKSGNKVTYITILAKDILSLKKIVDNICNSLSEPIKDQENKDDPIAECIEKLISTVKNSKIINIASENGQDIGISYEDIINKLISKKMEGNLLNYKDNFGKIFEPAKSDSNKIEKENLAAVLHELGYDEDMSFLPSWEKKSLGRIGRFLIVPIATTALGLAVAPILPVTGVVGLLCSSLIAQTIDSTFNIVRHKEWSSFNPDNWEVKKFVKNVVMDFAFYGVFKFFGW